MRLTHNWITVLLSIAVVALVWVYSVRFEGEEGKLLSKLITMSLYWLSVSLFVKFYSTRKFNVEARINEHPIALAIWLGMFSLGTALVAIFG